MKVQNDVVCNCGEFGKEHIRRYAGYKARCIAKLTVKQTPMHTPYSLGFHDGYQQGSNYYKRSFEWGYPQANDSYDQGVEDGQKACRAVNSSRELKELVIALRFWFNNGFSPNPSTMWDDGETWKQKVQRIFENLIEGGK